MENKIIQIAVREACPAAVDHGAYSKRTGIRLGPNVSYLCVPHHIEWHRRMTGHAWCPKPVSAVAA